MAVLVAAVLMISSFTLTAFADPDANDNNTITITIDAAGTPDQDNTNETYTAYKILDVTKIGTLSDPVTTDDNVNSDIPNSSTGYAYSIDTTNKWFTVLTTQKTGYSVTKNDSTGVYSTTYFTLTPVAGSSTKYNVELKDGVGRTVDNAKLIAKFLADSIPENPDSISLSPSTATQVDAGYYLITSSLGENFVLATSSMTITEKNDYPSVDKKVLDLDDSNTPATSTTASVGQDVTFRIPFTVPNSANQKVVLLDTMSAGLTLVKNSFVIKIGDAPIDPENFTVTYKYNLSPTPKTGDAITKAQTAAVDAENAGVVPAGKTFIVELKENYVKTLNADTDFVLTYNAELNQGASIIGTDRNPNTVSLKYSNFQTADVTAYVDTYKVELQKTDGTNPLLGAKFALYKVNGGTVAANPVKLHRGTANSENGNEVYRVADSVQLAGTEGTDYTTEIDLTTYATAIIEGLGNGDYIFREIQTPNGYLSQEQDKSFTINKANLTGENKQTVVNRTTAMMPNTGGMGTTVLYIVGGMLVILAGAYLFFSRKRTA